MKKLIILCFYIIHSNANFINSNYNDIKIQKRKEFINKKIESIKSLDKKSQIEFINNFFNNHIKYSSDIALYNKSNYIAPIEETILTMKGDCDDYVLAKLQALKYLGFKNNKIFFNYEKGIRHVKIITKINDSYYLLDSLNKNLRLLTKKDLIEEGIKIYDASLYLKIAEIKSKKVII